MFRGTSNRKDFRFDNPRNKCTASYVQTVSRKFVFAGCNHRRPRPNSSTAFEVVVNRSKSTRPSAPAPYGGGSSGRSLERGHRAPLFRPPPCCAALRACSPLRRAPPRVGYAAPPPQGGLARSGVPPLRLGRAVGLSPWLFVRCRRITPSALLPPLLKR